MWGYYCLFSRVLTDLYGGGREGQGVRRSVDGGSSVIKDVVVLPQTQTISYGEGLCEEGQVQVQPSTAIIFFYNIKNKSKNTLFLVGIIEIEKGRSCT